MATHRRARKLPCPRLQRQFAPLPNLWPRPYETIGLALGTAMRTLLAALCLVLIAAGSAAEDFRVGALEVSQPWARASAGPAKAGAIYLTLRNRGSVPDRLIAAASPAADRLALHRHAMEGAVMKMRPLEGGLPLPAGEEVALAPGGLHIMMMGLAGPLEEGARHPLTLTFERAGTLELDVLVMAVGAMRGPDE